MAMADESAGALDDASSGMGDNDYVPAALDMHLPSGAYAFCRTCASYVRILATPDGGLSSEHDCIEDGGT